MKTFEEWFRDQRGCTEEQFRQWCLSNLTDVVKARQRHLCIDDGKRTVTVALYKTPKEETEEILAWYHRRYREEFDRECLDTMELDFSDWLSGYYHLDSNKLHELYEATGTKPYEDARVFDWYRRRYMEYVNMKELDAGNPFKQKIQQ